MSVKNQFLQNEIERSFLEFPIIETKRFRLKKLVDEYKESLINLFSDDDVMKYSGTEVLDAEKQAEFYLKKIKSMYKERQGIRWAIINKESNEFIGDIGLYNIDFYSNNTEVGYSILKKFWRQGVVTECIKEIEKFAFEKLNMNRIIAMIDKNNIPSIKLVEKLGFYRDGILREHYYNKSKNEYISICVYSVIKSDIKI